MFAVSVEQHFDAAHYLRDYHGKCENLHGHRFVVVLTVSRGELDGAGMAYDFTVLKQHLNSILGSYDHTCLNAIPPFEGINPSSENIATTIYGALKSHVEAGGVRLVSVEVRESPENRAVYTPE
ncbi:MAG: 6-carboxytetrahydropterin synthase QueD [Chloroflexota bacterium]